jgi:opacity protein-like surface antigen
MIATRLAAVAASTLTLAGPLAAQDGESLFGVTSAGVTYGPYVRAEIGVGRSDWGDAYWLPAGESDPKVFFDLGNNNSATGGVAFGFDRMDGFRFDVSLNASADRDATGPWSSTSPSSPGPHADITGAEIRSTVLMANAYFSPLEYMGRDEVVQPFVTAGLGVAWNRMSTWTRFREGASQPERSYEGDTTTDFAWTVGAGVAWSAARWQNRPVLVDVTYRYSDLGEAKGSTTPIGTGDVPREPLTVENRDHSITIGLRIPLQAY